MSSPALLLRRYRITMGLFIAGLVLSAKGHDSTDQLQSPSRT
jgi:hypothetical protein